MAGLKTMNFTYSTLPNKSVKKGTLTKVTYNSTDAVSPEDYEIYSKVFKTFMDAAVQHDFSITEIALYIRDIFKGYEESMLVIELENKNKRQKVQYLGDSVGCWFEDSKYDDKVVIKDDWTGLEIYLYKSIGHLTPEKQEETMKDINDFKDQIVTLRTIKPTNREEEPTIFGYPLSNVKKEHITFSFDRTLSGIEIKPKTKKGKRLILE